jgi:predicted GNAT superfamily acetyltransferase
MFIITSIILFIIYLYKSGKLQWIVFKINKNKLLKSTDLEIVKILIEILNNFGMKRKINFNNILLTFDSKLDDSKLECTIYSWIDDMYEKFPCQFIYEKDKNETINSSSKIIIKMNIWKGSMNVNTFNV